MNETVWNKNSQINLSLEGHIIIHVSAVEQVIPLEEELGRGSVGMKTI
jgi:hypothetical protein